MDGRLYRIMREDCVVVVDKVCDEGAKAIQQPGNAEYASSDGNNTGETLMVNYDCCFLIAADSTATNYSRLLNGCC